MTRYMATPVKARVGKSRGVQPATLIVDGPHNPKRLEKAIVDAFYKHCYNAYVVFAFADYRKPDRMQAKLYHRTTDNLLGTIIIEEIED